MKRVLVATLAFAAIAATTTPVLAAEVGVSIGISEPGVYGRIDIGRFPQPQVVVPQPIIIEPAPRMIAVPPQPVYMWVPYEHRKNWDRHCRQYNACGVPVYFVRHDWYDREVRGHGHGNDHHGDDHHDKGKGKGKGHD